MSKIADHTYNLLKESFPHHTIFIEHYVKYKSNKLFFDFFIKELSVLIEVQGRQHDEYVEHFHGDRSGFFNSMRRDNLKKEYCQLNDMTLVEIRSELTKDELINEIWKGINK